MSALRDPIRAKWFVKKALDCTKTRRADLLRTSIEIANNVRLVIVITLQEELIPAFVIFSIDLGYDAIDLHNLCKMVGGETLTLFGNSRDNYLGCRRHLIGVRAL
ncbi:hypothetical protein SAMN03097708_02904 [Thiohalomonas denitrificans]|uniref:Uncharacterized protein n=1 Tax=Thiohalomonas denitrificans TaxID=415747 RepID=A0A1G5QW83_9GAMM|nr:hypothetical protein SAMN03097708_02904 [Thiohalomonas denitrificans]